MRISELYLEQNKGKSLQELVNLFTEEGYTVGLVTFTPEKSMYVSGHTQIAQAHTVLCVNKKIVTDDNSIFGVAEYIAMMSYLNRKLPAIKVDFKLVNQGRIDSEGVLRAYCGYELPNDLPLCTKKNRQRLDDFISWAADLNNPDILDIDYLTNLDEFKQGLAYEESEEHSDE